MFLNLQDVTLRFLGVTALDHVSFEIPQGGVFAIIGPNGAGKSTLLNCLSRFYTPQEGTIEFDSHNLLKYAPNRVTRIGIGRSFQNIELFKKLTVEENLLIGLHNRIHSNTFAQALRFPSARKEEQEARKQVWDVLEQLGIREHAHYRAGDLPYGVQKRVDVGRALVSRPKLLLLDEPAAGMNETESAQLGQWIASLPDKMGVTVVMVEHDMPLVMGISHRIAVLEFGKLIAVGSPEEIRTNPAVITAYLGEEN